MARFFYFSGAIFALVLLVLAALPYMVPRSLLRAELEDALSHLTGYQVRVVGSLQVRLLPMPYLFARQVRLSIDRSVSPAGVLLALDEVEAGIAVLPLFRGKVDFSFLHLVRPVLTVDSGDDFFGHTANRFIHFSSVMIEDGTLKYLDLTDGRQIVLRAVNGKLSADSLSGPLKTQARFIYQGERYQTDISIGRWAKRRMRTDIELRSRDRPDSLRLSGSISTKELGRVALSGVSRGRAALNGVRLPNFRGEISVNASALDRFISLPENIKLLDKRSRITANVDIQNERIKLNDFLLETEKIRLEGHGLINLSDNARMINLSLSSPHIDFVHILHDVPDTSERGMINGINDLSQYLIRNNIALDLSADVKVFMREDYQIKDVALELALLPDRIAVDLNAVLPGSSALKLTMSRPREESLFTGRLNLEADDFSALSSWFVDDEIWSGLPAALPTQSTRTFNLSADLEANHSRAKLNKIKARLDGLDIKGSLSNQRSGVMADLSFALDRLALDDESLFAVALSEAVRWGIDIKTQLAIGQITWRDIEIKNFRLSGHAKERRFVFDQISASGLKLGKVAVRGVLDWQRKNAGRWRLDGDVGGSAFAAVGRLNSKNTLTEIKAKLSHRNAAHLAKQLGVPASLAGDGHARAVLHLNGWPKDHFKIAAGARFGSMRYMFNGEGKNWFHQLTGQITAKGYAPQRLISAAGLDDIARASNKEPFMFEGNLSYFLGKSIKVDRLKLTTDSGDIEGDFSLMRNDARGDDVWLIQSDLRAKRLPLTLFEPNRFQTVWSSRSLPLDLFKRIKGRMKVKAGAMLFGGLAFRDSRLDIDFLGTEVRVKNFDVGFASGRISGMIKLSQRGSVPKFDLHFSARDMDLGLLTQTMLDTRLISGALDISGAITARGATPAALMNSLDGSGKITTSAGSLYGLDMALLNRAVPQLSALSHLGVVLGYTFRRGKTDFNKISGEFVVKDGVVASSGLSIFAVGVNGEVDLSVNLGRRVARSAFLFTLPARPTYPPVAYIVSGSWLAPQKKFNAAGFEQSFASELIHRGIGKIKTEGESEPNLPIELIDLIEYARPQS